MRSILALQGKDFKKHSALISHFRSEYIKIGTFDDKMSDILRDLFYLRGKSDYDDFYVIDKKEIEVQIENTDYFLEQVKNYLSSE